MLTTNGQWPDDASLLKTQGSPRDRGLRRDEETTLKNVLRAALVASAIAAMAGVALLGERLSLLQWLAIATIIVAAAGTALSVRRPLLAEPLAN